MNKLIIILIIFFSFPMAMMAQSNSIIITGKLSTTVESELIGALVVEVDKTGRIASSTATDFNGEFSLKIKNTENRLKFSYVGCKAVFMPIGDNRRFDVVLEELGQLKEVTVVAARMHDDGTFLVPEREVSGAVQSINTKAFEGMSVASIDDALQGRIAGLDIVGNSGDLGSGSSLRIRGITSINAGSTPLILLNDVPFESNLDSSFDYSSATGDQFASLLSISPDDIEEITVLKDGAAAAVWGAKGANGVISIKTKRGVVGPTRVAYSYRFSGAEQPRGIKMLNGDDYTMLMKQAYFNRNQNESEANISEFNYDPTFSEYEEFNNNTDWVNAVTQYGFTNDHNLSISGGGEKARFRASLGYYEQSGTVIKQKLQRFSNRINLEYRVSDRLKFTSDFSMTYTMNHKNYDVYNESTGSSESLLDIAYKKMPNVSIYRQDSKGNDTNEYYNILQSSSLNDEQKQLLNPVAVANLAKNHQNDMRIIPTLRLQYDFIDPNKIAKLRYNGYISFDIEDTKDATFLPREVTSYAWNSEYVNRAYEKEAEGLSVLTDQNITWVPDLGKDYSLTLYGSWQMILGNSNYQEFLKYGLPSTSITDATADGYTSTFNSGNGQWRSMAILGRVHYTYKGKYVLDGTLRYDGSTRFGPKHRWGAFPAISGKWIISDEKFMQPMKSWLNELGLRAGWGVTGNQPTSEYLYFSRYNGTWSNGGNNYMNIATIKPASLKLSNLEWERSSSINVGVDVGLLDSKITFDANVYHRRTSNLLFQNQSIPSSTGFSTISYINAGTMDNNGWELNFNTNNLLKTGNWTFDFNFNLSNYINKIVKLDPTVLDSYNSDFDYGNGSYLTRIQEGNSFGSIYGFRFKGVYKYDQYQSGRDGTCPVAHDKNGNVIFDSFGNAVPMYFAYGTTSARKFRGGDAIYEDINHDGTIDELDIVYLGNSNPKINGGFGTTIRYKRFVLNTFFNFRTGNKIINYARMNAESMYNNNNQSIAVNWRWRKDGDETNMPRALYQMGYNFLGSDRFVEDGSFLRCKQLTLSYSFSPPELRKIKMNQLSLSLTLNNLFTLTKYTGVDPEVSPNSKGICADQNKTPRSKYFTMSLNMGF